tara:strand:+ start:276 stop:662 length:387 start_codon:yes stop_codon:yes gene_type:complete
MKKKSKYMAGGGGMKKSKYMAAGGGMKKSKYMAAGGGMKKSKYMANGGGLSKREKKAMVGEATRDAMSVAMDKVGMNMSKMPNSVLSALGGAVAGFGAGKVKPKKAERAKPKKRILVGTGFGRGSLPK